MDSGGYSRDRAVKKRDEVGACHPLLRLLVSLFRSDTGDVGDQRHPKTDLPNSQNKYVQDGYMNNFYFLNFSNALKVTIVTHKNV